jgi:hypothetical protein
VQTNNATTAFVITGLSAGTQYSVWATVSNAAGPSAASSAQQQQTGAPIAPTTPTNIEIVLIGDSNFTVTWQAPSDNGGRPVLYYTIAIVDPSAAASSASIADYRADAVHVAGAIAQLQTQDASTSY